MSDLLSGKLPRDSTPTWTPCPRCKGLVSLVAGGQHECGAIERATLERVVAAEKHLREVAAEWKRNRQLPGALFNSYAYETAADDIARSLKGEP